MSKDLRSYLVLLLFFLVVFVNALSNTLPLNGLTQRQISEMYPLYIVPSPYAFSIWGIIYLGLLLYVLIQLIPSYRYDKRIRDLDLPFALSCLFNTMWIFAWHYLYLKVSLIFMLGILSSLLFIYVKMDSQRLEAKKTRWHIVHETFSCYFAWIGLATILNVSIVLSSTGWSGWPLEPESWTVVLLFVALGLYLAIGLPRKDCTLFLVLAWASFAIQVKNVNRPFVATAGWIVFGGAVLACVWCLWYRILRDRKKVT